MSKWTPRYSPEQRDKVWRLRRVEGRRWKEVLELCREGDEQVAGFQIGMSAARYVVDTLDRRYAGRPQNLGSLSAPEAVESVFRRVIGLVDRELAKAEQAPAGKRDLIRITRLVKLVREVRTLAQPASPGLPDPSGPEHSSAFEELLREQQEALNGGQPSSRDDGSGDLRAPARTA